MFALAAIAAVLITYSYDELLTVYSVQYATGNRISGLNNESHDPNYSWFTSIRITTQQTNRVEPQLILS